MDVKLGGRYLYNCVDLWDIANWERDMMHHGRPCRALRPTMPKDYPPASQVKPYYSRWWVVFDDGYITVASSAGGLCPLPTE